MHNTNVATRRRRERLPAFGNVEAGANGQLTFTLTIQPELLDHVMNLAQALMREVRRSMSTRDFWKAQKVREKIDSENNRQIFYQNRRIALSVYKRTQSITLACKAGDWGRTTMRMFLQDAKVKANKERKKVRNKRILKMSEAGLSIRNIASIVKLSYPQISRIVKTAIR